ncbi:multidrug effflux MFS transporter [Vibrio palustris]|uniref:Bcr/CflA family efflux transporter n=1 Tax=Vibrio palustris TaxID=1918946 RepID=A0A1R4B7Y0_9VIBR|nr:multidrug effflux MFS transporter [Vibrio palustris]SJL85030.1 Multidrug resistance protein MdtL [Vibrio palustris]
MPTLQRITSPARYQMILLTLLVLFSPLGIDIYLPALPLISETFHVEHALAKYTITVFLFSMGLGQLFAGPLADRYGRRTVALGGIILYCLSSLMAWQAHNIEWMLTARLMQGFGACATSVAAFATVRDVFGADKSGRMISYLNGAICFIPALAPILGSYLTQAFSWRANFSFMVGYSLVAGAFIWRVMTETNPATEEDKQRPTFQMERYWSVIKNPVFLFHASLCMLAMAVILSYVTSAPLVLMERLGLSMNSFTFWFGINAALNIVACMTAPKIMDKLGTHRAIILGIILLGIAGALMVLLSGQQSALRFMLPIFISSIGFAWVLGASAGKALAPFGDRAGIAAALLGLLQMSGSGFIVMAIQSLDVTPYWHITIQMWLLLPGLAILFSPIGKKWHQWVLEP